MMLSITVPAMEYWDETKEEFIYKNEKTIQLEHSLVSVSKWEAKWHKPFFNSKSMTYEENLDYVRCMTITQHVEPDVYLRMTEANLKEIEAYILDPMTATTFSEKDKKKGRHEVVTSELIYYWMVALNIPMECQKWHLNRLLTLIRICNIKNTPPKKMSKNAIRARNKKLNEERKRQLNTRG